MNDKLANTYRESQRELFSENERLRAELDQALTKLRYALAVIDQVEFVTAETNDYFYCPWCLERWGEHKPDCLRQLVLQMQPLEVGEK